MFDEEINENEQELDLEETEQEDLNLEPQKSIKERKKPGPRTIVYVVGGMEKDKVVVKKMPVAVDGSPANLDHKKGAEEATDLFKFDTKIENILFCEGPFYYVRDANSANKRNSIRKDKAKEYPFTGKRATAIYEDWSVLVNYTTNPDLVMILWDKVLPGMKKTTKPPISWVNPINLLNITEISN